MGDDVRILLLWISLDVTTKNGLAYLKILVTWLGNGGMI